jgi:moderate conductance mechanosensitive channel
MIFALVGGGGYAQESLSPTLTAIQPAPVPGAEKQQWLTLQGSGFTPESAVTLRRGEQVFPIPAERTRYLGDTELEIFVNVSTGPATWTVEVTNPGAGRTARFSFEVISPTALLQAEEVEKADEALEEERKQAVETLERKAEATKKGIRQAEKTVENARREAEKVAAERAAIQQKIEKKEQATRAAREALAVAQQARAGGDLAQQGEPERITREIEQLEKAAVAERGRLAALETRERLAEKATAAAQSEIEQLRREFTELRKQRANKRTFLEKSMTVAGIIFVGIIIWVLKRLAVKKFEHATAKRETVREGSARLNTLVSLLNWLGTIIIVLIVSYLVLDEFGINMGPVLAGAGIIGLALGFGGQYLIRDIINGIFLLVEGQLNINDIVRIGEFAGVVEGVNLRHTKLRDLEGRVIYIPNGEIKTVVNFTKEYGRAVIDIGVAYKENVDRVMAVMQEVTEEMRQEPKYGKMIRDFEMFGVERFGESEVTIRCRFKTLKAKQWEVAREYRRRIKNRFDELGIEIPFPHRTLYWGRPSQEHPV